jgi:hypothetical protein
LNKTIKGIPLYLISAILANVFYYAFLIPAAFIYPGYSPFTHTVSALGNTAKNPNGWFLFSISLILIGIALVPFFIEFKRWVEPQPDLNNFVLAIQLIGYFNSFSLVMIAIFPTNSASLLHNFWSLMNFLCIEVIILLVVIGFRRHPSYWKRLSIIGIVNFAICATYLTLYNVFRPIATIFEWLTFIFALGIILLLSLNMYKKGL